MGTGETLGTTQAAMGCDILGAWAAGFTAQYWAMSAVLFALMALSGSIEALGLPNVEDDA